jgi:hypothetical protein
MWFVRDRQLNIGLNHVYYLVENLLIMVIMYNWLESQNEKRLFQALILLYMPFWTIAKVTFEPLNGLYSYIGATSQILLTSCAEYTLFLVVRTQMQPIIKHDRFWVLLSFVIYYAGTLLITASRGILVYFPTQTLFIFASIDWSLKIIFNILLTVGFLCPRTRT